MSIKFKKRDQATAVPATIYFRSKLLEISKSIHFWNHQSIGYPEINVGICTDTVKAANLDFQNGRHKIRILRYLGF